MSSHRPHPATDPPRSAAPASDTTSYLIAPTVGWMLVKLTGIGPGPHAARPVTERSTS